MLFGLRSRLDKRSAARARERQRAAKINAAIDHLIDGIDPNIRLVPGHKKKLAEAVGTALGYIDRLVDRIPGPIEFNKRAFGTEPLVNALFASASDLQKTFSQSEMLRAFFDDAMNVNVDQGYALMCMEKEEHAGFGMGLEGDIIKRDVPRITVNFFGHNLLAAATTEKEVRASLKNCMFDALISNAFVQVMSNHLREAGSDEYRKVFDRGYKKNQAWGQELTDLLLSIRANSRSNIKSTEKISGGNQNINNSASYIPTPTDRLEQVKNILSYPESIIWLNHISMNLTRLGLKVDDTSTEAASRIELAELEIANVWRRIVLIVKYPRNEMLAKTDFFSSADEKSATNTK